MKNAVTVLLFSLLLPLVGACSKTESTDTTDTTGTTATSSETASATHPGSPGGTALVPDVTSGTTVLVMLQEGSIAVREQAIPPGPAIFTVENRGKDVHNLFIEGEGISRAAGDSIPEGQSSTVDVNLKAGTYTLYCPILDHRTKGEEVKITVGTSAPTGTTDSAGSTATSGS
jgi:hypothetical protein